jgi:pyridoxal 5'-phosphate synthase pdxT subunit
MTTLLRVGILALQGAVQPHRAKLARLGADVLLVRDAAELAACRGLILPGGESTTMLKLIHTYALWQPLLDFAAQRPLWGVCAGSILMAEHVEQPAQESLAVMPITVRRNAYGRQNESFIAHFPLRLPGQPPGDQEGVFIRAPQVISHGPDVAVLAECAGMPVALAYRQHLTTTFHPELAQSDALHRHFLRLCGEGRQSSAAGA